MDLPASGPAGSACGRDWTRSGCVAPPTAVCGFSPLLLTLVTHLQQAEGGEVLVTLPQPVCLRGEMLYLSYIFNMALQWDVPIVSLVSQWVGKKNLFDRVGWSTILCGGFTHK